MPLGTGPDVSDSLLPVVASLDIIYLTYNRLDFTRLTFHLLLANTDWSHVDRLIVFDDGSTDGTREWLDENIPRTPVPASLVHLGFGSPVSTMNYYLQGDPADRFVKVDSDVAMPPGWLGALLAAAERHPEIDLLGMEAGQTWLPTDRSPEFSGWDGSYTVRACSWIGGVGLMRTQAFRDRPAMVPIGRFGFTKWQQIHEPPRAWIEPDLLCPQLDRIPVEPFVSLSRRYIAAGWQREWPMMDPDWGVPYWGWIGDTTGTNVRYAYAVLMTNGRGGLAPSIERIESVWLDRQSADQRAAKLRGDEDPSDWHVYTVPLGAIP